MERLSTGVGMPSAAAVYRAGRARRPAVVMSGAEPGSMSETHHGMPSGAARKWMLPPFELCTRGIQVPTQLRESKVHDRAVDEDHEGRNQRKRHDAPRLFDG
jgi:hypothetical protein